MEKPNHIGTGMSELSQQQIANIIRPSRYMGNEVNSVVKDPSTTEVFIALAFPDVYEVVMSHLGLKILYHILNDRKWLAAERAFAPWVDLEKAMRAENKPVTALESGRPLSGFDIVGFSLQHELSYTNVLNMLDLSGIPFRAGKGARTTLSSSRAGPHVLIRSLWRTFLMPWS